MHLVLRASGAALDEETKAVVNLIIGQILLSLALRG
jgi:hypothetical protein